MPTLNKIALAAELFAVILLYGFPSSAASQTPTELPLLAKDDIQYEGAFRIKSATYGSSDTNFAQGPIEYNRNRNSIFFVGHSQQQQIAEFPVPAIVKSTSLNELKMSDTPLQIFSTSPLERTSDNNPQNINRIMGMHYASETSGAELIVNAQEYYDAPGDNTHTTLVIRDAHNIAGSQISGFFRFPAAAHASGWISQVPTVWQALLGGSHITGNSSGQPIIGRLSVGPSAFAFNAADLAGNNSPPDPIPAGALLDYSLTNPLHEDLSNGDLSNNLWTHLSQAVYGLVVPGTRSYAVFGHSGGHNSGVCYKCTQDDGNLCGGYCSKAASDNYHYYWFYDLKDLLDVKNGAKNSWEPRPYDYGKFQIPFNGSSLGGGSFDPVSGRLFLAAARADTEQGQYSNPPIIVSFQFNTSEGKDIVAPAAPKKLRIR